MRKSLLKQITWEEVKEIVEKWRETEYEYRNRNYSEIESWATESDPIEKEVLRRLRGQNGVPSPIEERFPGVLACAEIACGQALTDSRERENTQIRQFVAYRLHNEGYSYSEIGKMLKRDHSTVTNLVHRMRDMLSLPNAYKWEVQQYKRFEELL